MTFDPLKYDWRGALVFDKLSMPLVRQRQIDDDSTCWCKDGCDWCRPPPPPKKELPKKERLQDKFYKSVLQERPTAKREQWIGRYRVDVLFGKTIIELYGDYWHCNPFKYQAGYVHPNRKQTAQRIWEADEKRKRYLETQGYRVVIVWERDYLKDGVVVYLPSRGSR